MLLMLYVSVTVTVHDIVHNFLMCAVLDSNSLANVAVHLQGECVLFGF
jgi:hypothetical protein